MLNLKSSKLRRSLKAPPSWCPFQRPLLVGLMVLKFFQIHCKRRFKNRKYLWSSLLWDQTFLDSTFKFWTELCRSPEGKLQPDPKRFPSGIPALADYIHKLGLKFGIYEDYGNLTCGGYPGSALKKLMECRGIFMEEYRTACDKS